MLHQTKRAAELRARAAEFAAKAEQLPDNERREVLAQHRALLDLATVDEWVAAPAHVAANHDYNLKPKVRVLPQRPRRGKPGRKILSSNVLPPLQDGDTPQSEA